MKIKKRWIIYSTLLAVLFFPYGDKFIVEHWMRWKLRDDTIVVAFSTTPHRINAIGPTLQSLYKQNINIDHIYISIPYIFKRDNLEYEIPNWLSNDKRVEILRSDDYGPATKLLGVLEQADLPPDAIIITVDDDINYPKNLVLQLAYKAKTNPNHAVGLRGSDIEYDPDGNIAETSIEGFNNNINPDAYVSFLQGYAGIAYQRKFFDHTIFDISQAPRECINSDDLYLSFYIAKHNIKRQLLLNKYLSVQDLDWGNLALGKDALHNLIPCPGAKHRVCVAYMKQQDPHVKF